MLGLLLAVIKGHVSPEQARAQTGTQYENLYCEAVELDKTNHYTVLVGNTWEIVKHKPMWTRRVR